MTSLVEGALDFLENAYDENAGLFSSSTRLSNGTYLQRFEHPTTVRYTINALLGLTRARSQFPQHALIRSLDEVLERFLARQYPSIRNPGDFGLVSVLLSEYEIDMPPSTLEQIQRMGDELVLSGLNLQDVSWTLWGATAAAKNGVSGAEEAARKLFRIIERRFFSRDSLLARHGLGPWRSSLVSFGATTYFLRALYEYGTTFGDEYAETLFRYGVEHVLEWQGPQGQWPWMWSVGRALPVDLYPVFSVHQDSMAMLFLHPAAASAVPGAEQAVERSLSWLWGENELSTRMVTETPFFINRSIERKDMLPRLRRYARSVGRVALGRPAGDLAKHRLRINRECRSYHLGWILYVWSDRDDIPPQSNQPASS